MPGSLEGYLDKSTSGLEEDVIRHFGRQIGIPRSLASSTRFSASAMIFLRSKNVVHRDIKPANILLHDSFKRSDPPPLELTLKLSDFGFAKFFEYADEPARLLYGSAAYMAPEVLCDGPCDERADLFSIGIVLFECLEKTLPFPHVSVALFPDDSAP